MPPDQTGSTERSAMIAAELKLTARAAELLTAAYTAHETGDLEAIAVHLGQALQECGEQAIAVLWAAALGDIPAPDDAGWPDFVTMQRQVAEEMKDWPVHV
jgi:hypothetical protein